MQDTAKIRRHRNKKRRERRRAKRVIIIEGPYKGMRGELWATGERGPVKGATVKVRLNGGCRLLSVLQDEIQPVHQNGNHVQ